MAKKSASAYSVILEQRGFGCWGFGKWGEGSGEQGEQSVRPVENALQQALKIIEAGLARKIKKAGIYPVEQVLSTELFHATMEKRGIRIDRCCKIVA